MTDTQFQEIMNEIKAARFEAFVYTIDILVVLAVIVLTR